MASENPGMVATCYLGKQRKEALDKAIAERGWLHSHYVRIAVLEKLVADGYLTQGNVEMEVEKAEYRKQHPHGNSLRARARAGAPEARASEKAPEETTYARTARSHVRKLTPAQRKARRAARGQAANQ